MIDEPIIGDRFAVAVGKHRLSENLGCLQRRGRRQADTTGVEIIEYTTILREVLRVVADR
ncbi:hypothetical protein D3C81_2317020 [compost metagenome]